MKVYLDIEPFDNDFSKNIITTFAESAKFKTMWYLRHLEQRIVLENGQIIIQIFHQQKPTIKINGFSDELKNDIENVISEIEYKIDLLI
jgi:hypothetical protein